MVDAEGVYLGNGQSALAQILSPQYQAQQLQLKQAQAFQNGVPTDSAGNPDYGAMANKLMQLGAYGDADKLMNTGIAMNGMRFAQAAASDPLLTGGGTPAAGGAAPAGGASPDASQGGAVGGSSAPSLKAANPDVVSYIRQAAAARNISPDVALAVSASEGLRGFDPNGSANPGDGNSSFGPFQLHYGNVASGGNAVGGMGDDFTKATGLDARDPSTWKQQVDFSLDHAAQNGWGAYHGAARAKISNWAGIGTPGTAGASPVPPSMAAMVPQSGGAAPVATAGGPSPAPSGQPTSSLAGTAAPAVANSGSIGPNDPVPDNIYQTALRVVGQAQDRDPSTMTLQQQQAVTRAQELVTQYQRVQNTPPAGVASDGTPTTPDAGQPARGAPPPDVMAAVGRMKAGAGTPDDKALYLSWASPANASGGTSAGAPAPDGAAPVSNVHPFFAAAPGVPRVSNTSQASPTPAVAASPAGGLPPTSFGSAPAPSAGPSAPQLMAGGAIPPGRQPPPAAVAAAPMPTPQPSGASAPRVLPPQGSPAMMTDPTMGGLLRNQWVGNPGGYALALRQKAAAYSVVPSTQKVADQFSALANQIDQGIQREGLITPEMKNYSVARQQGYTGTMMQFQADQAAEKANAENASRLASDTDPSRLQFAGQQAAATAAGTAAGQNAPAAIAGRAANAAAVGESTKAGDYLGGLPATYAKQADAARAMAGNVDEMLQAAQGFRLGAGAGLQQDARKALQGTLGFLGVSDPKLNDPTASFEDFGKMAGVLNRNAAQQVGGRTGVQEMQLIGSTLPSPEMSYDGFRTVASSLKGSADYTIAKQQAAQDWAADPAHRGSLAGFEATFNKNTSPAAFWLNRLRVDQPDLFSRTLQGLGQTPQGLALLAKARAGMQWANSNGLFN